MQPSTNQDKYPLKDLSVVIPVYNEDDKQLNKTMNHLKRFGAEVIIVDDGSDPPIRDRIVSVRHTTNKGYGAALKSGIREASHRVICTMDGDGQHTVEDVIKLYQVYKMVNGCKMVVGMRWDLQETRLRKYGRKCLNFFASCLAGHYLVDLNSGMRIMQRDLCIGYEHILCDTFSYTTSITMSMVTDRHKMVWLPIEVKQRTYGQSKVKVVKHGWITLRYILVIGLALRTRGIRKWLRSILGR